MLLRRTVCCIKLWYKKFFWMFFSHTRLKEFMLRTFNGALGIHIISKYLCMITLKMHVGWSHAGVCVYGVCLKVMVVLVWPLTFSLSTISGEKRVHCESLSSRLQFLLDFNVFVILLKTKQKFGTDNKKTVFHVNTVPLCTYFQTHEVPNSQ